MSHGLVFTAVAESGIVHSRLSDHTRLLFLSTLPCSSSFGVLLRQEMRPYADSAFSQFFARPAFEDCDVIHLSCPFSMHVRNPKDVCLTRELHVKFFSLPLRVSIHHDPPFTSIGRCIQRKTHGHIDLSCWGNVAFLPHQL